MMLNGKIAGVLAVAAEFFGVDDGRVLTNPGMERIFAVLAAGGFNLKGFLPDVGPAEPRGSGCAIRAWRCRTAA